MPQKDGPTSKKSRKALCHSWVNNSQATALKREPVGHIYTWLFRGNTCSKQNSPHTSSYLFVTTFSKRTHSAQRSLEASRKALYKWKACSWMVHYLPPSPPSLPPSLVINKEQHWRNILEKHRHKLFNNALSEFATECFCAYRRLTSNSWRVGNPSMALQVQCAEQTTQAAVFEASSKQQTGLRCKRLSSWKLYSVGSSLWRLDFFWCLFFFLFLSLLLSDGHGARLLKNVAWHEFIVAAHRHNENIHCSALLWINPPQLP